MPTHRPRIRLRAAPHYSALALLAVVAASAAEQIPVPRLVSPVMDLTRTLDATSVASLEQELRAFEARKGSQIAVLLVPTTQPETIEQYSIRVVDQWKLGRKGVDDGALLLVAKNDRVARIEVGYGLEGALPDVLAHRIVDQVMVPRFRNGDFAGGIAAGVERMIAVIEGEPLPPAKRSQPIDDGIGSLLPLLLGVVLVGGSILTRVLGKFMGAAVVAGIAGSIVWITTALLGISIGVAVAAFLVTLVSGGGNRWSSGGRGLGAGGWGGGGLGGGGGWSGGGGGFGGGGASGRW